MEVDAAVEVLGAAQAAPRLDVTQTMFLIVTCANTARADESGLS